MGFTVFRQGIVHAAMGGPHSKLPHYSQGTGTNCSRSSVVVQVMERQASWGAVRQLSSGEHH